MQFEVLADEAGFSLLSFLRKRYEGAAYSIKALKRAIDSKKCRVNGRVETFSTYKLKAKDRVVLEEIEKATKPLSVPILYEDADFLVCNKPAGAVCEQGKFPLKGLLVHRLDKETSGALIVAKKAAIFEAFEELFVKGLVTKEYLAVVDGQVKGAKGHIDNFLIKKHAYQGQTIYGSCKTAVKGARRAVTTWWRLKVADKATLLLCRPITGRTHQLRVHLKEMGHPILGDYQYARQFVSKLPAPRHLLHAWRLSFPHPISGQKLEIKAPLPDDLSFLLRRSFDTSCHEPEQRVIEDLVNQVLLL